MKCIIVLSVLTFTSCTGLTHVSDIGIYETRETCEKQKDVLNEYHKTKNYICTIHDSEWGLV